MERSEEDRRRDDDEADEASMESFPASDAPVGWAGRDEADELTELGGESEEG